MNYIFKDNHYINNDSFRDDLLQYLEEKNKNSHQQIPDSIGQAILSIANNLAKRSNFCGYTFKEELIGDAIETCIKYLHNYDVNKSSNPFAYFTQICFYAFVRRIKKEKVQYSIKRNIIKNLELIPDEDLANYQEVDKGGQYLKQYRDVLKEYDENYDHIYQD